MSPMEKKITWYSSKTSVEQSKVYPVFTRERKTMPHPFLGPITIYTPNGTLTNKYASFAPALKLFVDDDIVWFMLEALLLLFRLISSSDLIELAPSTSLISANPSTKYVRLWDQYVYAHLRRNMDVIIGTHIKYIRDHDPAPEKLLEKSRHPFSSLYINQ